MTKREKLRILKAMLPLIDTETWPITGGLCCAYADAIGQDRIGRYEQLAEIGLFPPKSAGIMWYPIGLRGDTQRRAAIRRAIARLQKKAK